MHSIGLKKNKNRQTGFTLVELMLVLAVIIIIAGLAINAYRSQAGADRWQKAALEMQQVLQAGITYNVASGGQWPTLNSTVTSTPPCTPASLTDSFIVNYLPNQIYTSNLGSNYCWGTSDSTLTAPLFWVAARIPATANSSSNIINMANNMAARLPNAIVTKDPTVQTSPAPACVAGSDCYVRAEVAQPSSSGTSGPFQIAGIGYCIPVDPNNETNGTTNNPALTATTADSGVSPARYPFPAVTGSPNTVTCKQLNDPSNRSKYSDAVAREQYIISFNCPGGFKHYVYASPNFYSASRMVSPSSSATNSLEHAFERNLFDFSVARAQFTNLNVNPTTYYAPWSNKAGTAMGTDTLTSCFDTGGYPYTGKNTANECFLQMAADVGGRRATNSSGVVVSPVLSVTLAGTPYYVVLPVGINASSTATPAYYAPPSLTYPRYYVPEYIAVGGLPPAGTTYPYALATGTGTYTQPALASTTTQKTCPSPVNSGNCLPVSNYNDIRYANGPTMGAVGATYIAVCAK